MIHMMMEMCVGSVGCCTRATDHCLGPAWGRLSAEYMLVFFAPIDDLSLGITKGVDPWDTPPSNYREGCPRGRHPWRSLSITCAFAVWGECSHILHIHCLPKWLGTALSIQQSLMDHHPWGTYVCPLLIMGLGIHETDSRLHSHWRMESQ